MSGLHQNNSRGLDNQHRTNVMNTGRFQDQNIPTSVNELDRINMPLIEFLKMEGILHNYEPAFPIEDTSHYLISFIL